MCWYCVLCVVMCCYMLLLNNKYTPNDHCTFHSYFVLLLYVVTVYFYCVLLLCVIAVCCCCVLLLYALTLCCCYVLLLCVVDVLLMLCDSTVCWYYVLLLCVVTLCCVWLCDTVKCCWRMNILKKTVVLSIQSLTALRLIWIFAHGKNSILTMIQLPQHEYLYGNTLLTTTYNPSKWSFDIKEDHYAIVVKYGVVQINLTYVQ